MCRSIKTLRTIEHTDEDVRAAALQFVRKVSGFRAPSKANAAAFDAAVDEVTDASLRLLAGLAPTPTSQPTRHTHTHDGVEHEHAGRQHVHEHAGAGRSH
jgi:hypothetical protein